MGTIPRILHYVWVGNGQHTALQKKCMRSWKKYCPDFEIKLWNEASFDLAHAPQYVRDAYQAKKWAFVSDYIRLWAVYQYGGVYLDTDSQILKPIDHLLENHAFMAFESNGMVTTGVMGAEKNDPILKELLDAYQERTLYHANGEMNTVVTGVGTTAVFTKHGLQLNGKQQMVDGWTIYPFQFFYPVKVINDNTYYTNDTCIVHWFEGTWISEENARARAHDLNPVIRFLRKLPITQLYYKMRNGG